MTHTGTAQTWPHFAEHLAYFTEDETLDGEALGVLAWLLCQPPGKPLPWAAVRERFLLTEDRLAIIVEDLQAARDRLLALGPEAQPRPPGA